MRKFKFAKLVRDKIVEQIDNSGNTPHWRVLSHGEYLQELKNKIVEEAQEIPKAAGKELSNELADVQELIDNLLAALNLTKKELTMLQKTKNKKNGSFKRKHYVAYTEVEEGSEWMNYYLKNPQKYPEIT